MRTLAMMFLLTGTVQAEEAVQAPVTEARAHYQKGTALFNLGEYGDAADEYKLAYKSLPEPVFLYNIAQAYRLQGDLQKAAFFYVSYARNAKDPVTKREAETRARKIEAQLAGKKPPEPKAEPEPRNDPPPKVESGPPKADPKVLTDEPKNTKPVVAAASPEAAAAETPGPAWTGSTERLSSMTDLIKTHRDQFRFCYDAWAKKHPKSDQHVKLTLVLHPDGKLDTAEATATTKAPELERCIIAMSKQLTFPPSTTGKLTKFNYPFEFKYRPEPVK